MRQRIAQMVKQSGNPAYLDILSLKQTSPGEEIADSSTHVIVQVLGDTANWVGLWQRVLELPFMGSVAALGELLKSGWQPPTSEEQQLFQKLTGWLRAEVADSYHLKTVLPTKAYKLLIKPFSTTTAHDWANLKLLAANNSNCAALVQNSLAYIGEILAYRFSHAIEIESVGEVVPTKTDIEL